MMDKHVWPRFSTPNHDQPPEPGGAGSGLPQLTMLDPTPRFHIEVLVAETQVPMASLRSWGSNYGFPSPWKGEETLTLYSERDLAAVRWVREQVGQMSVRQAVVELVRLEPDYVRSQQAAELRLPQRYALSDLRDSMMQAVVMMNRASSARLLANASATYPLSLVCQQLVQPILIYTFELRQRGVLPPAAEMFARTLVQLIHPFFIEACISSDSASQYLTQLVEQIDSIASPKPLMSATDLALQEELLLTALCSDDAVSVQTMLDQIFFAYNIEDICVNLFASVLSRLLRLGRENKISAAIEYGAVQLLQKQIALFFHSMPSLQRDSSILVGCIAHGASEFEALMLALLWRRAGLQVRYLGEVASTEELLQPDLPAHPTFIYLQSASPLSLSFVAEVGRAVVGLKRNRPMLCFGGSAFEQVPRLAQNVPGVYLGFTLEETARHMEELLRLSPLLSAKQVEGLIDPRLLRASFPSPLNLNPGFSILVGCTPQKASEVDAFLLALLWRRSGLQVHYVGSIANTEVFLQHLQTIRPAVIYITSASRMAVHWVAQMGRAVTDLKQNRPTLCFGGSAFEQAPRLAQSISGVYLGSTLEETAQHMDELLRLSPLLSPEQVEELMAPNSFRASFQKEIVAANASTNGLIDDMTMPLIQKVSDPAFSPQVENVAASERAAGGRGTIFYPGWSDIQKAMPGLLLVVFPIALLSEAIWSVEIRLHATFFVDIFIAAVLSLIAANVFTLSERVQDGLTFSTRWFLRLGILCYGLKFSFLPLLQSGPQNLLIVATAVTLALGVSLLAGRLLNFNPRLSALIGVGTGICGISATMAASPAIGARDEETAVALGTILCWGTTGLLLYPLVGSLLHLSPLVYGTWTGATIHDLPQLLATAQQGGGPAALKAALFVKLIRMAFIAVVIFFLHLFFGAKERRSDGQRRRGSRVVDALKTFPLFVLGFFLIVFVNTVIAVPPWLAGPIATWPATTFPTTFSAVFLMLAIIGICARVNRSAIRTAGARALALGLISWVVQSVVVLMITIVLHQPA